MRNRSTASETHRYLHLPNEIREEFKYKQGNDRYKIKFNKMKVTIWSQMTVDEWKAFLSDYVNIIDEARVNKEKITKKLNDIVLDEKEYTSKKALN